MSFQIGKKKYTYSPGKCFVIASVGQFAGSRV